MPRTRTHKKFNRYKTLQSVDPFTGENITLIKGYNKLTGAYKRLKNALSAPSGDLEPSLP